MDAMVELALMDDGILRIARGEQHLHLGAQPAAFFGELPARHPARHDNIREQEIYAFVVSPKRDRAPAVRCLENALAKALELCHRALADAAVLLELRSAPACTPVPHPHPP